MFGYMLPTDTHCLCYYVIPHVGTFHSGRKISNNVLADIYEAWIYISAILIRTILRFLAK